MIGEPGPAIIYKDMLETYYDSINRLDDYSIIEATNNCYICNRLIEFNDIFVEKFGEKILETDLLDQYISSEKSILCINHFTDILKYLKNNKRNDLIGKLIMIQKRKITYLLESLEEFIDGFDYRSGGFPRFKWRPTKLAIEILKGSSNTSYIYLVKTLKNRLDK